MRARLVLALVAVVGRAPPGPKLATLSAQQLQAQVTVDRSAFKTEDVYASTIVSEGNVLLGDSTKYLLRTFIPRSGGAATHQLYIARVYEAPRWIFYSVAADEAGARYRVLPIDRQVVTCSGGHGQCAYAEDLGVDLPEQFLRDHAGSGFRIQLAADNGRGALVVAVPPNYVQGHLAALPAR
jgi:hypothetical protein